MSSKGDVKEKLAAYLRELHLPTFRKCFEEQAQRAIQETASYEQYLLELIDDIGHVQQSREEMEVLFTLLVQRYERGTVMLTSNLPFSKWEVIFKDPMTTAAAIDRLVHHSMILELNIASYRLETAKQAKPPEAAALGRGQSDGVRQTRNSNCR
jgi:DNA replication protein DnaC